jgi:hypothetical protein
MPDAFPVEAAILAGVTLLVVLVGIPGAIHYWGLVAERRRERGPVSVEVLSHGSASCAQPDRTMFLVQVRLHNPKAVPCRVTQACLSHQWGGYILRPARETRHGYGDYWFKGDMPIELPPKQHLELELGFPFNKGAFGGEAAWEEFELDLHLDDGSHACSKPFKHPIDLRKAR